MLGLGRCASELGGVVLVGLCVVCVLLLRIMQSGKEEKGRGGNKYSIQLP
jgi:hypothetical protein